VISSITPTTANTVSLGTIVPHTQMNHGGESVEEIHGFGGRVPGQSHPGVTGRGGALGTSTQHGVVTVNGAQHGRGVSG